MGKQSVLRSIVAAVAISFASSAPASASAVIEIGTFGWQLDVFGFEYTLSVEASALWPDNGLVLDEVYVDFVTGDGSSGQAFFGGYTAANAVTLESGDIQADCLGIGVSVGPGSSWQVPGYSEPQEAGPEGFACMGLQSVPQDIVSAVLRFSYDTTLGTVTVAALGTPFDPLQPIFFEAATSVPEPSTLALFGAALAAFSLRRTRV
jgi:hypothetical protein